MCIRHLLLVILPLSLVVFYNSSFSQDSSDTDSIESLLRQSFDASPIESLLRESIDASHETTQKSVQTPIVKAGDSYIFETRDPEDPKSNIMTKRTVNSVGTTIKLSTININNKKAKSRYLTYDRDWNLISTRNADKGGLDYSPPLKYYDFPLIPGKNWDQSSLETDIKSGKTRTHTMTGVVEGWENVSVPAGNFRAIKVSLHSEVLDNDTGEIILGTDDSWFVPEIGRSVKSVTTGKDGQKRIIQLMSYDLAER